MFVNTNIVPGSTQVHLAFSPLVVHGQGQRWPTGNSTFVCAKKGSSQRNAFTCVISFDSMQLPLGKVGAIVPTLQMRELRLRGVRQVTRITDLARGPKFLSPNPVLLHVTKACALLHPKPTCTIRELFPCTIRKDCWMAVVLGKQWSLPLWFTNSYLKAFFRQRSFPFPTLPQSGSPASPGQVSLRQEGLQYTWCRKE